jgi:hypothetical protein
LPSEKDIMQSSNTSPVELLKSVLSSLREPDALNEHPWAKSLPVSNGENAGAQLNKLVVDVFRKMIPAGPPRAGKRMDTRWGVFGILAAQYFAPALLGKPSPSSLREAWESIDLSILFFVYGRVDGLSEEEHARYRFAGNEIEPAPNSTLSDWHRKGLEQLAELTVLEIKRVTEPQSAATKKRPTIRQTAIALGVLLLVLAGFGGWKAWGMYQQVRVIEQKADALADSLGGTLKLEDAPAIADSVHDLRVDLDALSNEAGPYLWLTPYLGWVPRHGGDLKHAEDLLLLAQNLSIAADEGLGAVTPTIETGLQNEQPLDVIELVLGLQEASPRLLDAQVALIQAQAARERIDVEVLSPRVRNIITGKIDPLFQSIEGAYPMEDALAFVQIAPTLLGSGRAGPQTYLILMQNEDELRPTGGFLTAVASAVIKDGKLIGMNIESSDLVDDFSKPYPIPPWQFKEFMNIEMFLFRDSNWFTDFPTTVSWAEYFYSYTRASSADGVMTVDMRVIVRLLEVLGPVRVENVNTLITHENVLDYLRSAEETRPAGVTGAWDRKQFLGKLAQPLLEKILNARGGTWQELAPVLVELLDEKHILLQFDDEEAGKLIERRNWDGAVRIDDQGDFLMVVDTNMGYNKTNALTDVALEYDVNLADITSPSAVLMVRQTNLSQLAAPCEPFAIVRYFREPARPGEIREPIYEMEECHWGYLRIYTPMETKLLRSTPLAVPEESTWLGVALPARTDDLGDEDIQNAQVFGTMVLTPTNASTEVEFEYSLPATVLTQGENSGEWTYRLFVQKQPGTLAHPIKLTLRLPDGARLESDTVPFEESGGIWVAQLDLRRDLVVEVRIIVE